MSLVEIVATGLITGGFSFGAQALVANRNGRATETASRNTAQAQIEAKKTLDATQMELDASKQQKEYTDNLRADNERLNTRLDALTKRVDELWGKLTEAQQSITDNHTMIETLKLENGSLRDKIKAIQQEYEDSTRLSHDKTVDLQMRLNGAQARVDMLTLRLANCKCGANPPIEIGGSNVSINVETQSAPQA